MEKQSDLLRRPETMEADDKVGREGIDEKFDEKESESEILIPETMEADDELYKKN